MSVVVVARAHTETHSFKLSMFLPSKFPTEVFVPCVLRPTHAMPASRIIVQITSVEDHCAEHLGKDLGLPFPGDRCKRNLPGSTLHL